MKSVLYAAAAVMLATAAAQADPVSDRAGTKAPELGDRAPVTRDAMPVSLQREFDAQSVRPASNESGRAARQWSGNENEG